MMNNRNTRIVANTVGLAAIAALGITVYQIGTSPIKEEPAKEESAQEETEDFASEEGSMIDAGTDQVEAEINTQSTDNLTTGSNENTDNDGDTQDFGTSEMENAQQGINEKNTVAIQQSETENNTENSISDGTEQTSESSEEAADVSSMAVNLPEVNFSEDTLMEWPVSGNILVDYSMDQTTYFPTLDQYKLSPAISVKAVEGAPVMAAVNGTVYSIEQDAQTGTTLTMELGNGYQAIYGQLTDLTLSEGDTVKKGSVIGYVAQPTKYYSTEGANLYFAMKENGEPIDPIAYLP